MIDGERRETMSDDEEMIPVPSPEQAVEDLRDDGFHPEATCIERLVREASYHQQELDGLVSKSRNWQARAEKAEAEREAAYAYGLEDAAKVVGRKSDAARKKLGQCVSEGHPEDAHVWSAIVSHLDLAHSGIRAALNAQKDRRELGREGDK